MNTKDKTAYATINSTNIYGRQIWYFFNDTCIGAGEKIGPMLYKKEISFSACDKDTFNCGDGTW